MRVVSVVCEYNPFHKGHALHLARAREASGADYAVLAMSGPVTQRGTFARHSKWTRTRAALLSGADLVLELPARFACAGAQDFARGGVSLLSALGVTTHLSFGCEPEALPHLAEAARALEKETPAFRAALREGLARGLSFPRARAEAARLVHDLPESALALPNAALALEYLRALPPHIAPVPIAREGAGYHDAALAPLSSATAVRQALERGEREAAFAALPQPALFAAAEASGDVHEPDALDQALLYRLRAMCPDALLQIAGMDEGLHHRFAAAAQRAVSREALLDAVKSKRYTWARLSRLCSCALLGVTRELAAAYPEPAYARILGFRRDAAPLLHEIRRRATLPLIVKAAEFDRTHPLFALDLRAQDIWSLGCSAPALRAAGRDFATSPVIV